MRIVCVSVSDAAGLRGTTAPSELPRPLAAEQLDVHLAGRRTSATQTATRSRSTRLQDRAGKDVRDLHVVTCSRPSGLPTASPTAA